MHWPKTVGGLRPVPANTKWFANKLWAQIVFAKFCFFRGKILSVTVTGIGVRTLDFRLNFKQTWRQPT